MIGRFAAVFVAIALAGGIASGARAELVLGRGAPVRVACVAPEGTPAVAPALEMLVEDLEATLGARPEWVAPESAQVLIGRAEDLLARPEGAEDAAIAALRGRHEAFLLKVAERGGRPTLLIAGSDARGTAYGILELSRLLAVSPWVWWADVAPRPLPRLSLPSGFQRQAEPKVAYRGIFLNDEDWGLTP